MTTTITNDDIKLRAHLQQISADTGLYKIRKQAMDTVFSWINAGLDSRSAGDTSMYGKTFLIDSIIAINNNKDKVVMAKLYRNVDLLDAVMDAVTYFYGIKIKGNWVFFNGPIIHLPREYYQEDVHTPLSFETLKLLAAKYVYRNYLKKNDNGAWEINDKFFSDFTSGAWCTTCRTQREWDSVYLYQVKRNWSKRSNQ